MIAGFVNALAILIFMAQLPELTDVSWVVYLMTAAGPAIIDGFPLLTEAVPSPWVAIVVLTGVSLALGLDIRTVGDMGQLPDSLPVFLLPDMPLNLQTFQIILPHALTLGVAGLLESMRTASIVDELTDTSSNKNRECVGQHPPSSSVRMIATVLVTVFTHDLTKGVFVGVLLSGIFFAHKVGQVLRVEFQREGTDVEVIGLNQTSATLVDRFAVHGKPGAVEQLMH